MKMTVIVLLCICPTHLLAYAPARDPPNDLSDDEQSSSHVIPESMTTKEEDQDYQPNTKLMTSVMNGGNQCLPLLVTSVDEQKSYLYYESLLSKTS